MDLCDLGLVMRDIGNFDMDEFPGRLSLQKTVYILQSFGVNLGYTFNWYLHGTYCPELARDGYKLAEVGLPEADGPLQFIDKQDQANYYLFSKFVESRKHDPDQLEIAASVAYLARAGFGRDKVLYMVENKKGRFRREDCEKAWDDLKATGVIN